MLKKDSDLNNCISRLNLIINELNDKGYNLLPFDKKKIELNLGILNTDKPNYKPGNEHLIATLNYSLMDS